MSLTRRKLPRYVHLFFKAVPSVVLAFAGLEGFAGTVSPPYQIGTWEGFRPAAVSYTFDDDLTNQYYKAVPMFNALGFKLTLFTVTTWVPGGSWAPILTAESYGHEIGSHTLTHPDLSMATAAQVSNEVINSQIIINANVPGQSCVTLAYPDCNPPANKSIVSSHYIAARGCSGQLVPSTPPDFMNISSFVCGQLGLANSQTMDAQAAAAVPQNAWCVFLIHALDNESGYSPLPSASLLGSLQYMSANQNKFWVETFGHVVRYIRERNAASVTEISNTAGSITAQVTDNLDDSIYNFPITLRRPLPAGWPGAAVSQNGLPVASMITNVNFTNYVMFDAVPDAGNVTISMVAAPILVSNPVLTPPGNFTFRLDGQSGASYVIYGSGDLMHWAPVQTDILSGPFTNITVAAPTGGQFYRAQLGP